MHATDPSAQEGTLAARAERSLGARLAYFAWPFDARYEDLGHGNVWLNVSRDLMAGLIVAMIAIPLAMGFAMASGLRPEQGIVGGAVAGAVGALFGGSKYQVYGPTAAFIPVIAAMVAAHGYPFVVLCSIIAGVVLMLMGTFKLGGIVARVPHSIVVGFTIGIACVIALSQLGEILGLHAKMSHELLHKLMTVWAHVGEVNGYAVVIALFTFVITYCSVKISPFIPGPVLGVGLGTLVSATLWSDKHLVLIKDKFGAMPANLLEFSAPAAFVWTPAFVGDVAFYVTAIVFVSAVESLLCSRMADRLAGNHGTPYNPNKELWGQGWVQVIVPLLNGFPHTGALARTAANIRLGALSPLAGIAKAVFNLSLAYFLASTLERVPMACIGGILLYVAVGMVKWAEVQEVLTMSRFHHFLMGYTAIAVLTTDFLKGVLSAMVIWAIFGRFFDQAAGGSPLEASGEAGGVTALPAGQLTPM